LQPFEEGLPVTIRAQVRPVPAVDERPVLVARAGFNVRNHQGGSRLVGQAQVGSREAVGKLETDATRCARKGETMFW
jgi:hypothetical protein